MKHLILSTLLAVIAGLAMPSGALAVEATIHTPDATLRLNETPTFPHHHFHFHHAHHHRHHHHRRHHHRR